MSLDARIRHVGLVTIVELSGRIVLGEDCVSLGKLVSDLLEHGDNKILLDLADVHRIDTAVWLVSSVGWLVFENAMET